MKMAIPVNRGQFCDHFGGAEAFALYTVDEEHGAIGDCHLETPPEHGRGVFPMWLRQQGVTLVLAGGMGPRAMEIFSHHGIEVLLGVHGRDPEKMVHSYLAGTLEATGEVCHEPGFHDCGHDRPTHGHKETHNV